MAWGFKKSSKFCCVQASEIIYQNKDQTTPMVWKLGPFYTC